MFALEAMNLKNKLEKTSLNFELEQLKKAEKSDVRMLKSVKKRFHAKYGNFRKQGDVNMHQALSPGFCYHRDGQPREFDIVATLENAVDYQDLVNLLFTNGELDTKKILCLHALSSQPCESLKPSPRSRKSLLTGIPHEKSVTERLIYRSRFEMGTPFTSFGKDLPIYILNVNQNKSKPARGYNQKRYLNDCCIRDGRLATRLVINENITRLVQAVLEALQRSNPAKMSNMMRVAQIPLHVKEIVNCMEMQPFLLALSNCNMLLSSNSYYLTRPFMRATHIDFENPAPFLVKLVNKIRNNVLKDSAPSYQGTDKVLNIYVQDNEDKYSIKTNMSKSEVELDEEDNYVSRISDGFNAERMSQLLYNKIREAQERDMKQLKKSLARSSYTEKEEDRLIKITSSSVFERLHSSASVRQSNKIERKCEACNELFLKEMMPSKRIERSSINQPINMDHYKALITKSTQWLNYRIDEESKRLYEEKLAKRKERMDKRYSKEIPTKKNMTVVNENRRSGYLQRKAKNYAQYYGYKSSSESTHVVNKLNLAKIKHEISVKENSKRVKKFLDEPLFEKRAPKSEDKKIQYPL